MNVKIFIRVLNIVLPLLVTTGLQAKVLEGAIFDTNKRPVVGAQISLIDPKGLYAETVYTDDKGMFALKTQQQGQLELRARKTGFADLSQELNVGKKRMPTLVLKLHPLRLAQEISDSLTASAHFSRVKFEDATESGFFRVECLTCHQLGNQYTRTPRSKEHWQQIVKRMLGFYRNEDEQKANHYVDLLMKAFDGGLVTTKQWQPIDPALFRARITQWKLPQGVIAHDVEYHPELAKFYTVDQGLDQIYITDPASNVTKTFTLPVESIPVGGKFLQVFNEKHPFNLSVRHGPHSLQEGPDGKYYITETVSGRIGVFDPVSLSYKSYEVGGKAMYPHTLRFDKKGKVWFTISVSNQVGRFDPVTKEMRLIDLPDSSDRPEFPVMMPYGIDINPLDGSVWYSRLMANRIGRIDPDSLFVQEFKPPLIGPRRMRFDNQGRLWIPSYGDGSLVRLDTQLMEYTKYLLPTLSPGEVEAPYAVGVHPDTEEIWITANMSDRVFRFLPNQERFITYPLPTRGIFLRDMVFTPNGRVCASSSMAGTALAVEGGMQEVICIDP